MSGDIAIRIRGLGKKYTIGGPQERFLTFRDVIVNSVKEPFRRLIQKGADQSTNEFWALKDVSFDVHKGEVIGIIGRNGAGKSTLLKILSRITTPTEGEVDIFGRVGSLLEVGTGFHSELTGRENIFLSGSILGMRKTEIEEKYDEIVKFSEIEKFIDTPVKRYSSGMYVRLAFAVAAHLDPEILIVDEVLAVGDASFQKKCLGKMGDVAKQGRTVLFVSHNMGAVAELCPRCVHLTQGKIFSMGETKEIIEEYLSSNCLSGEIDLTNWTIDRMGNGPLRVLSLSTKDVNGNIRSKFKYGEKIIFNIIISGKKDTTCIIGLSIRNALGQVILHFSNLDENAELKLSKDQSVVQVVLEKIILNDGTYYVTVWLGDNLNILHDRVGNCLIFTVESSTQGKIISYGLVRVPASWRANSD